MAGIKKEDMREAIQAHHNFQAQNTLLEELVESRGHLYLPTYHCKLNPIKRA